MLTNSNGMSAVLRRSNIENRIISENCSKHEKENYYTQWEENLKKREIQLDQKYQQLKQYSKQLKIQSDEIVKQKLELGEKIEKYNRLLESIVNAQLSERQIKKNVLLTPCTSKLKLNKCGINECQQRVADLLQKIRNTSRANMKTQQQSYFGNNSEYEEILFSKRQNHSSSFTQMGNTIDQVIQQHSKEEEQSKIIEPENDLMNHHIQLQQMESSQKQFYSKVYEEMNKLKKQL